MMLSTVSKLSRNFRPRDLMPIVGLRLRLAHRSAPEGVMSVADRGGLVETPLAFFRRPVILAQNAQPTVSESKTSSR